MDKLVEGYHRFREERWPEQRETYEKLAKGQTPRLLVIACCDSRVDPGSIFDVAPGEIFVVRNVANLVPPIDQGVGLRGTAAAIEFAVAVLQVKTILVMGHARCGGVTAALDKSITDDHLYVGEWVSLLSPAVERCSGVHDNKQGAVEREAVRVSMERLLTYPFVKSAVENDNLNIEGAWFDVANGKLELFDTEAGAFRVVD